MKDKHRRLLLILHDTRHIKFTFNTKVGVFGYFALNQSILSVTTATNTSDFQTTIWNFVPLSKPDKKDRHYLYFGLIVVHRSPTAMIINVVGGRKEEEEGFTR